MIQANELRIGSWVYDSVRLENVKLHGIEPSHDELWLNYCHGSGIYKRYISNVNPIPLTEEILLKCGLLLYDELDGEYRINETRYSIHKVTNFDGFLFCDGNNVLSDIKYLHQLQNLYHALTGQELKIEL